MPRQPGASLTPQTVPLTYSRETKRLYCRGLDLNDPVDSIKEGYYPILENLRSYTSGIIQPRQGITQVAASVVANKTPVHSVRRLNDVVNNTWARILGVGDSLAYGQTSFTRAQYNASNITLSGNPLALVPYRPNTSTDSWMYVTDSLGMYKIKANGTVHQIGLPAPTDAPTVNPRYTRYDTFISSVNSAAWTVDGTVATAKGGSATRINTTTVRAILDTPWYCIVPTSMTSIGPGQVLTLTNTSTSASGTVLVAEIYRGSAVTSVDSIIYDNAPTNTGTCTIIPVSAVTEIKQNAVVRLNSGGANVYAKITEVITGPNSSVSFRCSTGASTISATQDLQIVGSFRGCPEISLQSAGGDTIADTDVSATFAFSGANVTGWLTYDIGAPRDFGIILGHSASSIANTGMYDDDNMHFTFKIDDLSQIIGGRIMFDIDSTTNDFTQNYYYRSFTPSDLLTAAKGTQTAIDNKITKIQRDVISGRFSKPRQFFRGDTPTTQDTTSFDFSNFGDIPNTPVDSTDPNSPREQTGTGDNQTHEISFRRGDCIRVGTDWSRGWGTVLKVRLELTMTATGAAHVRVSDFTKFGGFSPDVGDIGAPYLYRYRYRCSTTGAKSNWSPETRSGVIPLRNNVSVAFTASTLPEVDYVDIQRWGGSVTEWAYVGSQPNGSSPFIDTFDDQAARGSIPDSEGDINYQPWIISDSPVKGTGATLAGSVLFDNSAPFDTSWVKNTPVKVNGTPTSIYRVISTKILELTDCVGSGTVSWEISEPFKGNQKLPCFWGPYNGRFFACGDTKNPGRLYFSNSNNPDSTQDIFFLDITSPSDPLQNGYIFNGRCYVFSCEKLFEIIEISPGQFVYQEVPSGCGLLYRWAFCVGPLVWFLSKDGIYETDGGTAREITQTELFSLFPTEGRLGTAVNGFLAPNMINDSTVAPKFRLSYYDNFLYFDYIDTNSALRTLVYSFGAPNSQDSFQKGWYPDVYTPGITYHYGEEGSGVHALLLCGNDATTAKLYTYGGTTDNGTAVSWHFRQASWDTGDRRADKLWGDFIVDADPGGGTINVAAGLNNYASTATLNSTTMTGSGRTQKVFDINSGNGVEAKNFAVDLSGTGTTQLLYLIEPSYTFRPEDSFLRAIQYDDTGYQGEKFFQGIEIEADTYNIARTVRVEYDNGQLGDTLTIQHNGRVQIPYSFSSAFVAHMARLIPTDSNLWKLYKWRWVSEPEPPLVTVWESQQTTFGHTGFVHLRAIWVTHTSTADLTLTITRMDDNTSQSFIIPNSGGVRGKETYLPLGPAYFLKGKTYKFKITQASNIPFRIYQRNTGVMLKPWASAQAFSRWMGWGGDHGDGVAQI